MHTMEYCSALKRKPWRMQNTEGLGGRDAKWDKPMKEVQKLQDSTYMKNFKKTLM